MHMRGSDMQHKRDWMVAALITAALPLSACGGSSSSAAEDESGPATVEPIDGTKLLRVTLTAKAAERLGIQTDRVRLAQVSRNGIEGRRKVIPYAAVLYGTHGETSTYTNPQQLVYVRQDIDVDYVDGNRAVLAAGPASGTAVVTVGAAELLGAESDETSDSGH